MLVWMLLLIGGGIALIGGLSMAFAWFMGRDEELCPGGCGDPMWDCLNKRAMCPPLQER